MLIGKMKFLHAAPMMNAIINNVNKDAKNNSIGRDGGGEEEPGEFDVICGRGKATYHHAGNKRLRTIVDKHLDHYSRAKSRVQKSTVVSNVVDKVRALGGTFVRLDETSGLYDEVSDRMAREKVGQLLRDALGTKYRSSTQAKRKRRRVELSEEHEQITEFIRQNKVISTVMRDLSNKVSTLPINSNRNCINTSPSSYCKEIMIFEDDDAEISEAESSSLSDEEVSALFEQGNATILAELKRCEDVWSPIVAALPSGKNEDSDTTAATTAAAHDESSWSSAGADVDDVFTNVIDSFLIAEV